MESLIENRRTRLNECYSKIYSVLFFIWWSSYNLIEKAKNTILLVDQTKFFHTGFYKINQLSAYKTIISDAAPDPKMLAAAEDCGTEWIY